MRVLSFALALFAADMVVEAGVCKPALTTTAATSIAESTTAASETSVVESLTSATETLSTDSSETLTASTTEAETTSTEAVPTTTTETLIFTLTANGQLATGTNNNYLCLNYKPSGVLGPLVLCPFDNFQNAPLKCTRAASGTLSCTVPNGSCTSTGSCTRPNSGIPFSQFYVDGSQNGYFGDASGNFGSGYTAIDVILAE
ncbi:hypothetical protein LB503_007823 [Fusarium chuoi]|nr:hypothetical protein LB503_007823 [Fusarium chuoi]